MRLSVWLLFFSISLFGVDYDCILIGTSPFSLFEALYQYKTGKKVLILEESSVCGGAWKGIEICGLTNVDLGCHHIGADFELKTFLETYAGCHIVSMDHPQDPFDPGNSPNGWYFSKGCYQLIENLLMQIRETNIVLLTEEKAENALIDKGGKIVTVQTKTNSFTTYKLILTPMSSIALNHSPQLEKSAKTHYYHLYLLIQDPTPPCFTYQKSKIRGISRIMNLTHFVDLAHTGRQLVVVQTQKEQLLHDPEAILEMLKKEHWLDESAYILRAEPYIYESGTFYQGLIQQTGAQGMVELLQTGHLRNLTKYIPKWEKAFKRNG